MAHRLILVLFSLIISTAAFANAPEKELIKLANDAFSKEFPKGEQASEPAFGDLNNDGMTDFATLLLTHGDDPNDFGDTRIVVFFGNKDKLFSLYKISGSTFRHERIEQTLEIKKDALFLFREGGGSYAARGSERFQFKMRANDMMLIGVESTEFAVGDEPNDYNKSINLITGDVVQWRKNAKKRKEIKAKFTPPELIKLENFNYEKFTEPKGSEGYIDENFNLIKLNSE